MRYLKARHAVFGVEALLGKEIKVTAEAFDKKYSQYPVDSANPYQTLANLGGSVIPTYYGSPLLSAGTGFARGVELRRRARGPAGGRGSSTIVFGR